MRTRLAIAALVFLMPQGVLFGIGTIVVLATPLAADAMTLLPWVVAVSALVAAPLSWVIAPRMRARNWRERERDGRPAPIWS